MEETLNVEFHSLEKSSDFKKVLSFNADAFADTPGVEWSESSLKKMIKEGWFIFSLDHDDDVIAVLFMKRDDDTLITKNTPIKMAYQGNGLSHLIKDFYEQYAQNEGLHHLVNECAVDNFRMISLNEKHGYERLSESSRMISWKKTIK